METISKGIKNKIKHAFTIFHMLVNYLFNFFIMYIPFHFIRLASIKLKVKEMGQKCSFLMGVKILNGNNVYIGNNCVFNRNVTLDGRGGKLRIGNNVDIAQEVNIWTLQHDPHDDFHRSIGNNVIIEDYVWISSESQYYLVLQLDEEL